MVYILWGQDDYSLHQSLLEIKSGLGDQTLLESNLTELDGEGLTVGGLGMVCNAAPFLSERRLVVVKGLLGRFEPKNKFGRRKKVSKTSHEDECKLLAGYISGIPGSTVLVLVDDRLTGGNPLFSELASIAEVRSFPVLRSKALADWIKRRAEREGGSISLEAVSLLAGFVGSNLWVMASEIDKLVQYTSGRRIEAEDISKLVSYAQEPNVFAMIDAILDSRAEIAQGLLQRLLEEGATPASLLVRLSRQFQRVLRARVLKERGMPKVQIQSRLSITQDFILRRTLEQAQRYTLARLKEVYQKLLEADLSIKTGKYPGELALNILVAELCR